VEFCLAPFGGAPPKPAEFTTQTHGQESVTIIDHLQRQVPFKLHSTASKDMVLTEKLPFSCSRKPGN